MSTKLGKVEGRDEVATKITITKAGDGLSAPLRVEPRAYRLGEDVYVVLKTTVGKVTHTDAQEGSGVVRQHTLDTTEATIVDEDLVRGVLAAQRTAVEDLLLREEEAKGAITFPARDDETEGEGRPEGMSDDEWMASAATTPPTDIGSRKRRGKAAEAE